MKQRNRVKEVIVKITHEEFCDGDLVKVTNEEHVLDDFKHAMNYMKWLIYSGANEITSDCWIEWDETNSGNDMKTTYRFEEV